MLPLLTHSTTVSQLRFRLGGRDGGIEVVVVKEIEVREGKRQMKRKQQKEVLEATM